MKGFFKPHQLALGVCAAIVAGQAAAHGYLSYPPSRAALCQQGLNANCGAAQYEPQSVGETDKGFPALGPADGQLASGGKSLGSSLDVQSAGRWTKTELAERDVTFDWQFTAAHPATKFEYYITRQGWNPNEPLTRAALDAEPFCSFDTGNQVPIEGAAGGSGPLKNKHACTLPADRTGYHVVYGIWTVGDTAAAFYNVADVDITAETGPAPIDGWKGVANIPAVQVLLPGDTVTARAFRSGTESPEHSITLDIASAEQGQPANWAFDLATKINATQQLIRAGMRDESGNIEPVRGANSIYAKADSGVTNYQMGFDLKPDLDARLSLEQLQPAYELVKGQAELSLTVRTNRRLNIEAGVYDTQHKPVGTLRQVVEPGDSPLSLSVRGMPGDYRLTVIGSSEDGRANLQVSEAVQLTGDGAADYDNVFPNGLGNYKAGTRVLQPKNEQVYECKPFPAEGWCNIYSATASQYEPGVGSHWEDAWIAR
ncbi:MULTISPECIES: N-acetylglucosamine-binding protein GbpA [Pseudomonas]|uniref:N-acetylglucosamine-binding protein GbpA n=1 Tax=Pseudomonas quercus TaxID=2722792 RepID=A0ABX0YEM2_9PSED|nr:MULTISPECIES: N-acetylglucosamine-binding protein GbpA [Pseudomonas]MBF7142118.1 N-acetylglucosamine-binding protein GbpA [Pseudomonas sp. LY10J]NJP00656.1 N-acetylglucosamine-binding protein GbpA [Pseudomonas quercus]